MEGKRAAALLLVTLSLIVPPTAAAAVKSQYIPVNPMQGTLRVESDADDSIVVACVGARVLVNGAPPDTGPLECSRANQIDVAGGPGDNRIDLGGIAPAQAFGTYRGVAAYATVDGRAGNDVIVGPTGGDVTLVGGSGSDYLQGQSLLDRYVFGGTLVAEHDTIVEPVVPECRPSYFDTNQGGLSYWTVPWDSLDFTSLAADDPVTVDERAPAGVLAAHRNRVVVTARPQPGIGIEAIAGGAGDDRIATACMAVGGAGDDVLKGTQAGDLLLGGGGDDELSGGSGPDRLDGGAGADELYGEHGPDSLVGAEGNDALRGGADGDVYLWLSRDGAQTDALAEATGRGLDVLFFGLEKTMPVTVDLAARSGVIARARGLEVRGARWSALLLEGIVGGRGDDRLRGNHGRNVFWSGGGADVAAGRGGNDTYYVDWTATMPYGAYAWGEYWSGPFDRVEAGWPQFAAVPRSFPRVHETRGGGLDVIDLEHGDEGITRGVRADLTASRWIVRTRKLGVLSAQHGGARHVEGLRGTAYSDVLIGNASGNVLDGRDGRDRVSGGAGRDVCVTYRDGDTLRSCERIRRISGR